TWSVPRPRRRGGRGCAAGAASPAHRPRRTSRRRLHRTWWPATAGARRRTARPRGRGRRPAGPRAGRRRTGRRPCGDSAWGQRRRRSSCGEVLFFAMRIGVNLLFLEPGEVGGSEALLTNLVRAVGTCGHDLVV